MKKTESFVCQQKVRVIVSSHSSETTIIQFV